MSAYLSSEDIPFVLHFADIEPLTLREAVSRWLKEGNVMTLRVPDAEPMEFGAEGILVNLGAVRVVFVSADDPDEGRTVLELTETDLGELL